MPSTSTETRVRYAETDQMGVAYHANYLVWCEIGRTEFIRQQVRSYAELEREGVSLAVSDASVRYHAAARYDEVVNITTTLRDVRSRALVFEYAMTRKTDGARVASARTTLVSLGKDGKLTAMPLELRALLEVAKG